MPYLLTTLHLNPDFPPLTIHRKNPKLLLDDIGAEMRWKRIVEASGRSAQEAKTFRQEFSNLRLMMTRMSNRLSEKTGFDPSLGKDAVVGWGVGCSWGWVGWRLGAPD